VSILYVGVPLAIGLLVGSGSKHKRRWAKVIAGNVIEPRAWDYLWQQRPTGYVRLRMKSGDWVGGFYGIRADGQVSWAAGYPEAGDLHLSQAADVNKDTGEFVLSEDGEPTFRNEALLVSWDAVEYLSISEVG